MTTPLESDRLRLFTFAAAPESERYTALLRAFDHALEAHHRVLGTDDVSHWLREAVGNGVPNEVLTPALDQLTAWGLLERSRDQTRASSLAEYRLRHSRYQFSDMGLRAWRAVRDLIDADPSPPELRRLAFAALAEGLDALREAVRVADAEAVNRRLHGLDREVAELAERSSRFSVGIASVMRATEAEPQLFLELKDRLLAHIEAFSASLQTQLPSLASGVRGVQQAGVDRMIDLATQADAVGAMATSAARRAHWVRAWSGIEAWFLPSGDGASRAELLDRATTASIRELLALLRRTLDARRRGVSRATELEALAARLHSADDADARALFNAAFQVHGQRWIRTYRDDAAVGGVGTSWHDAPPEPVHASLRQRGRAPSPGRTPPIRDATLGERRLRDQTTERETERRRLAHRVIEAVQQHRLLTEAELAALLRVVGRALSTRVTSRARIATTPGLTVELEPAPGVRSVLGAVSGRVLLDDLRVRLRESPGGAG
jgi:uncharacterized protein (TIGR02677 family)